MADFNIIPTQAQIDAAMFARRITDAIETKAKRLSISIDLDRVALDTYMDLIPLLSEGKTDEAKTLVKDRVKLVLFGGGAGSSPEPLLHLVNCS